GVLQHRLPPRAAPRRCPSAARPACVHGFLPSTPSPTCPHGSPHGPWTHTTAAAAPNRARVPGRRLLPYRGAGAEGAPAPPHTPRGWKGGVGPGEPTGRRIPDLAGRLGGPSTHPRHSGPPHAGPPWGYTSSLLRMRVHATAAAAACMVGVGRAR